MHLKNKIPAFQALERPIEGVHGEILRLPEEPNLEFRIVKASLRERSNAEKAVGFKGPKVYFGMKFVILMIITKANFVLQAVLEVCQLTLKKQLTK